MTTKKSQETEIDKDAMTCHHCKSPYFKVYRISDSFRLTARCACGKLSFVFNYGKNVGKGRYVSKWLSEDMTKPEDKRTYEEYEEQSKQELKELDEAIKWGENLQKTLRAGIESIESKRRVNKK